MAAERAPRTTLRRQLLLSVTLVHALLMGLFVADLGWRDLQRLQAHQREEAEALAGALAAAAAPALLARDLAALQQLLQPLAERHAFAHALLADEQGRVLAHTQAQHLGQRLADLPAAASAPLWLHDSGAGVDVAVPVHAAGRLRGWARVGLSAQPAAAALRSTLAAGLAYAALATALGGLAAAWLAGRTTRRLRHLQQVAEAAAAGAPGVRARLDGADEVAQLGRALDALLDANAEAATHHRLAAEAGGLAVWRWAIGAERVDWLAGREALLGPPPPAGWPDFRDMVHEDDREAYRAAFGQALAQPDGRYDARFRLRRTDGRLVQLHAVGQLQRDAAGQSQALLGVTRDISAEQAQLQRLAASEAFARQLFDASPVPLLLVDEGGLIVRANAALQRLAGWAPLDGRPVEDLVPPSARLAHVAQRARVAARLRSGATYQNDGMRLASAGGQEVPVRVTLVGVQHEGRPLTLAAVHDLRDELAQRQALAQRGEQLEAQVRERTAELERARQRAEALARVKSDFLAHMSHEVRTPLNAILGMAQLGRSAAASAADRARHAQIAAAGEHLLGIVNDVLDARRLEDGRLALQPAPLALPALLRETADWFAAQAADKGLGFDCRLDPGLPTWVVGDARRLRQILANLISNAVKFTAEGEVRMRAAYAEGWLHLRVVDTGPGMDAATQARLFRPFELGDASLARQHGGSGLGLAISAQLAQLMHGRIEVESAPGEGSAFLLSLPLPPCAAPVTTTDAPAPGQHDERPLAGLRVLVVDDVELNRIIAEAMLRQLGAEPCLADSGDAALAQVAAAAPGTLHAVLMDVQMPGMDGLEATRRLRALAPWLPVIGLTAHVLDEDRLRAEQAGMRAQLGKPLLLEELQRVLQAVCGVQVSEA